MTFLTKQKISNDVISLSTLRTVTVLNVEAVLLKRPPQHTHIKWMKISHPCSHKHFHPNKSSVRGQGGPCICRLPFQPKKAAGNFADWHSINCRGKNESIGALPGWIETQQTPDTLRQMVIFPPKMKLSIRREGRTDGEIILLFIYS